MSRSLDAGPLAASLPAAPGRRAAIGLNNLALSAERFHNPAQMNSKAPVVVLVVLSLGLLAALVVRHNKAVSDKRTDLQRILQLSNEWASARARLDELETVNNSLRADRDTTKATLDRTAAQLAQMRQTLADTERKVEEASKTLQEKAAELDRLEARAKDLESQNAGLEKQAAEMRQAIGTLEAQIAETRKRLTTAEDDRDFLLGELLRLQSEKASLERRLNDIVSLREQIARIREDLAANRRLEHLRRGLYGPATLKGGEVLQRGFRREGEIRTPDLEVELRREGGARLLTPPPRP